MKRLFNFFKKKTEYSLLYNVERGMLEFENTSEVIRAENILKDSGFSVKVMGPPPEIRTGCDLVIEYFLADQLGIFRELENKGLTPLSAVPVSSPLLKPVDLYHVKDFGEHLMVRAANMKITVEKSSLMIVNVSGGGCPDVPYLAYMMIGKKLDSAPEPRLIGHTLCGYSLQLAYEEVKKICSQ
ncbi:MAG: DUF3343 domain-containing protein [Nitrospirae bacterium]|nr:DUF3343 domain-containing protein [Nitrospirota bacterium]